MSRCEGYVKPGSFMTFGPRTWQQCENDACVQITVEQESVETFPACIICWDRAMSSGMKIISAKPILPLADATLAAMEGKDGR